MRVARSSQIVVSMALFVTFLPGCGGRTVQNIVVADDCSAQRCVQLGKTANYLKIQRAQRGKGPLESLVHDASRVTTYFATDIQCVVVDQPGGTDFGYDFGANRGGYGYLVLPATQGSVSFVIAAGLLSGFEGPSATQQLQALAAPDRPYTIAAHAGSCVSGPPQDLPKFVVHIDADNHPYVRVAKPADPVTHP